MTNFYLSHLSFDYTLFVLGIQNEDVKSSQFQKYTEVRRVTVINSNRQGRRRKTPSYLYPTCLVPIIHALKTRTSHWPTGRHYLSM